MRNQNHEFVQEAKNEIRGLESIIDPYFGRLQTNELPQVQTSEDAVISLLQQQSQKPIELIDVEIHHQTDPSYQ
mgnify:CR=1 FL=1